MQPTAVPETDAWRPIPSSAQKFKNVTVCQQCEKFTFDEKAFSRTSSRLGGAGEGAAFKACQMNKKELHAQGRDARDLLAPRSAVGFLR
jgi:hypothetical protein